MADRQRQSGRRDDPHRHHLHRDFSQWDRAERRDVNHAQPHPRPELPGLAAELPRGLNNTANRPVHDGTLGLGWCFGLIGFSMGNELLPPNPKYPNCTTNGANSLENPGMMGMSSYHPGGCNILCCDGSVKFLKDSTNQVTVWAIGSKNQGEVVSAGSY
jgi:prepilin-type processing-associated H-X9-DG protein